MKIGRIHTQGFYIQPDYGGGGGGGGGGGSGPPGSYSTVLCPAALIRECSLCYMCRTTETIQFTKAPSSGYNNNT